MPGRGGRGGAGRPYGCGPGAVHPPGPGCGEWGRPRRSPLCSPFLLSFLPSASLTSLCLFILGFTPHFIHRFFVSLSSCPSLRLPFGFLVSFLSFCLSVFPPPPLFSLLSISPFPFSFLVSFSFPLPLPAPLGPLLCSMPPTHPCQETSLADTHASPPPGLCVVPRLQGGGIAGPGCGQSPRGLHRAQRSPQPGVSWDGERSGGPGVRSPLPRCIIGVMGGQPGTHGRAQERGILHAHGRGLPGPAGTTRSGCISCQTFRVFGGCKGEH